MARKVSIGVMFNTLVAIVLFLTALTLPTWAQNATYGTISVTVLDPSGAVVTAAQLQLQDNSTNDLRTAVTQDKGTYTFVNLSLGNYKLTVTKAGFETQVVETVAAHATQITDVSITLKIGSESQKVEVDETATPLIETSSNAIGSALDIKQLEDLPITGRDVSQLSFLVPGYSGVPGGGTWNGLPVIAQGNNVDGVIASTSRMKFSGNTTPAVQARLEDIQEMTIQTDQLDVDQGYGAADMQVNFVTRRGTNTFHGRGYDNFQNTDLNANSWYNNDEGLTRNKIILNDFGGSIGGPIIRNKLFIFGSYAESKQPGVNNTSNDVLTASAQASNFTWVGTDGATHAVNLFNQIAAPNGLPTTVNPVVASEISAINGIESRGSVSTTGSLNINQISWQQANAQTYYFPTIRGDYDISSNLRLNLAWNETKFNQPGATAAIFPGTAFSDETGANITKNYTVGLGVEWTIKPTLVNSTRVGFLYNYSAYAAGAKLPTVDAQQVQWSFPGFNSNMSGNIFNLPTSTYYPLVNASDTMTWQRGAHTVSFGTSWFHEQDHYWNPPSGVAFTCLALVSGDPALNAIAGSPLLATTNQTQLAEAEQLYAVLTGTVGNNSTCPYQNAVHGQFALNPQTKTYQQTTAPFVLDELQQSHGIFGQDSWRLKTNFTLNFGMRWDFTGDDHDLKNAYESTNTAGVWGPSGINNSFHPGSLTGEQNPAFTASGHQYNSWNMSPQPQVGFAWNPQKTTGMLGKLMGDAGNTVLRGGFALRKYTEPYQFFWNSATDYGAFFYQTFLLDANTSGTPGTFAPGSLKLGDQFPSYSLYPTKYTTTYPESGLTFLNPFQQISNIGLGAINSKINQPYTQSWNFSIQRQLGRSNALEIRYVGSRSRNQWLNLYTNEVNIFENGFLPQFQAAQSNLKINAANGVAGSFANNGFAGQTATPVFDAAFNGLGSASGYGNGQFVTWLQQGQAGALASALAGGSQGDGGLYMCNLVGAAFSPCASNLGFSGAGAGYPINYFQANPFVSGQDIGYTTSAGYSNYNSLQVDFRQKAWHGMQFDVNYTYSHTLGITTQNSWTGQFNQFTLRNLRDSYGPTGYDLRHVFHANGTYDLPFGRGRQFVNRAGPLDRIVGGWTVGTILTLQSGAPFQLQGGNLTFNDYADGGVVLNGVTVKQLQQSVGVYPISANEIGGTAQLGYVDLINPKYLKSPTGGGSNTSLISPNTTPGTIGLTPFLFGPHFFNDDMAVTKQIPITERVRFTLQAEMLNVFNHTNFGATNPTNALPGGLTLPGNNFSPNIQNQFFGIGGIENLGRQIELRANIEF
jgi:hypothetical protein